MKLAEEEYIAKHSSYIRKANEELKNDFNWEDVIFYLRLADKTARECLAVYPKGWAYINFTAEGRRIKKDLRNEG